MSRPEDPAGSEILIVGIPAAPGIAIGPARRLTAAPISVSKRTLKPEEIEPEIGRFRLALDAARTELAELRDTTQAELGDDAAQLFDVQLLVLEDPLAVDRTIDAVRAESRNAAFLFHRHMREITDRLESHGDAFFSERAVDLIDVKRRVLRHLLGERSASKPQVEHGVLVGTQIAPSDAVILDPSRIVGLGTDSGGLTGHAAIMARAKGIPAVVGAKGLTDAVRDGDIIAVDGFSGRIRINPTPYSLRRLEARRDAFARLQQQQLRHAGEPAETRDGHAILLAANMETPEEIPRILERGAEGIGLVRTEFFFMRKRQAPSEDEQFAAYREILEAMAPRPVVFRVLDVGGDKIASYLGMQRERNPFLGLRGIRYLLAHPDLFRTQVSAILRAAAHGTARLMLPMVSDLTEVREARQLVREVAADLASRGIPHDPSPPLGVMVEVPSAVLMADELAAESDFLSVGSNDLVQYLLAIDRGNESLQSLYEPMHPAVLRALQQTVDAGHRHGRRVSICGEMAGDPLAVPLLLGLGFDRLSVSPALVPEIKSTIRALELSECRALSAEAVQCTDAASVHRLVETRLGSRFADLLALVRDVDHTPHRQEEDR